MKLETQYKIIMVLLTLVLIWAFVSVISYDINTYIKYKIFLELQKNGVKNFMNCITQCKATYYNPNYPIFNFS